MTATTINGHAPMCVWCRVPLAECSHGPAVAAKPAPVAPVAPARWSPARLAYVFYGVAATGAAAGQVWVAMTRIDWPEFLPIPARLGLVLPFAVCLELLAMALAAMGDERQRMGERAVGFRAFSAVVAVLAVGILVAGHWPHAYQVAAFGALSTSAYVLWLLHSSARRRDALRAAGQLATVAPAYGWWRRVRHPILTARAAELAREHGYGLYESLRQAELDLRAEARRPAIAAAVEDVVRGDHQDPLMAEIAVRTMDLDRVAVELETRADYAGWADRLAPAVSATRPTAPEPEQAPAPRVPAQVQPASQRPALPAARRSTGGKPAAGRTTADRVATARGKHPDATQAEIAKRLKVSQRTVARHWHASGPDSGPDNRAGGGMPTEQTAA